MTPTLIDHLHTIQSGNVAKASPWRCVATTLGRMNSGLIPFLWLCGPSGVGKSSVGWEVFQQVRREGGECAYLDADQIGLCYPATGDDPENHRVKSRNLGAIWPNYREAGAQCLVLSGGAPSLDTVRAYAGQVPGASLTLCRLRVGRAELRERFLGRGWRTELVDVVVREAEAMERQDFADLCVDTDGLSVADVARLVRKQAGEWPGS
jgi:hypothetical protein